MCISLLSGQGYLHLSKESEKKGKELRFTEQYGKNESEKKGKELRFTEQYGKNPL